MATTVNKSSKRAPLLAVLLLALVALSFTCTSVAAAASDAQKGNVVVLTEENFEHLTQASTGATTGDWLVEFYAPWCGHCKKLVPVWDELADELKGTVNVAKVDVTENSELGKRFGIRGYPTLLLFRQGKVYKFSGARNVGELSRFARSGYKTLVGEAVPAAPTLVNFVLQHAKLIQEDFVALLGMKKNVLLVTFSGGLLFGLLLGCLCGCCTGRGSATKKTKTS